MIIKPPKDYGGQKQITITRLEQWAQAHKVTLENIPEENEKKVADYKAVFPDADKTNVIIEVKEIVLEFEIKDINGEPTIEVPETGSSDGRFSSADPVRHKIRAARDQLKAYADAGYPTLLLVGMWTPALDPRLDLDIPIAMYGGGPRIRLKGPELVLISTARGGRQAADNTNRSISAVGRFERDGPYGSPESIVIYRHNNPKVGFDKELPGIKYAI